MADITKTEIIEEHGTGPAIAFPLARIEGDEDGPTVAITAGMHAGEYAGIVAAGRLVRSLSTLEVRGRVLVIPALSTQAVFRRSMQLSPVDGREVHYQSPGNADTSYSEHLIEVLLRTIGDVNAYLDLHGGAFIQDLTPYVCVPWIGDDALWERSLALAHAFDVPFVDRRPVRETQLALPLLLLEAGVPNVSTRSATAG